LNEQGAINQFYQEAEKIHKRDFKDIRFEYIFVDDGSTDDTLVELMALHDKDPGVRYISFSRNFGKEAAMLAGLEASTGDYVTLMDADLQDPPSKLREMYDAIINEGYDQVGTRRSTRKGESVIRSIATGMFYHLVNHTSEVKMVSGARDYRLMKRCVVDAILAMPESIRFSKGIFSYVGFKTKWLSYENIERSVGTSKWSFWGLYRYAITGIVSFSLEPLKIPMKLGGICILGALVFLIFGICKQENFMFLSAMIFLGFGLVLMSLGVIANYIAQIFSESKNRPKYIVRRTERDKE
jgi:glycosyltransferase involved in cell wall biosynthesis